MTKREAIRQTEQENTLLTLGFTRQEAEQLRRISMTLQRWFAQECGNGNEWGSWAIVRGRTVNGHDFEHDDDGQPFMEHHHYRHGKGKDSVSYTKLADRETGARRRLAGILNTRNARVNPATREDKEVLQSYVQTDPRGAALYIIRPDDVPEGADVSAYYTRGVCVY